MVLDSPTARLTVVLLFLPAALGAQHPPPSASTERATTPAAMDVRVRTVGVDTLDAYLSGLEPFGFAGAAVVARGDEVLVARGGGLADPEAGRPWTAGTVSSTGSITKQFTAAAILELEARGQLSVYDSLPIFFDEVPADKRSITLHHLLTHSSGLGEVAEGDFDYVSRDAIVAKALASELGATPGERYVYSNLGYSLLGAVVERVTGRGYEAWLRDELLVPAGLYETGYLLPRFEPERVAVGYRDGSRFGTVLGRIDPERGPSWVLYANGGIHATIHDMLRWGRALLEDRVASRERLFAAHVEAAGGHYGYGWSVDTTARGTPRIHHEGSNGIFYADYHLLPEEDVVLYVATSVAEVRASTVARQLDRLLFGADVPWPPAVETPDEPVGEAVGGLVGRYALEGGGALEVVESADQLAVRVEGQRAIERIWTGSPGGSTAYEELNRRPEEFVRALAEGDWATVRTIRGGEDSPERPYERFWTGTVERMGPFRGVEVLGTVPGWFHEGSADVTWLRLRFEDGATIRRIHWAEDGSMVGIGGSVYPAPLELRCALESPDRCVGFHLSLPTAEPRIRFERGPDGRAVAVDLTTASGDAFAARRE